MAEVVDVAVVDVDELVGLVVVDVAVVDEDGEPGVVVVVDVVPPVPDAGDDEVDEVDEVEVVEDAGAARVGIASESVATTERIAAATGRVGGSMSR